MSGTQRLRVYFDATRLLSRGNATPTGIDRVDLAYLRTLAADPLIDLQLLRFDLLGPKQLPAVLQTRLLAAVTRRWQLDAAAEAPTPALTAIRQWLQSPPGTPRPLLPTAAATPSERRPPLARLRDTLQARRLPQRLDGEAAVYLNTSHGRLYRKVVARWLHRSGIAAVFFVHDLIPLEYPAYNRAGEPQRHAARLRVISAHASRVLVNSEATRAALGDYLRAHHLREPPLTVLPLGVEPRFRPAAALPPPTAPYFLVLGTIEPRKNHQLLLRVWSRWIAGDGPTVPRLLVLGRRGWENRAVFQQLDHAPALAGHVLECGGLGDAGVDTLLRGACALLCPSFAEGYSLPVVEALAAGVPVLASDIAVHREVGGEIPEYLAPDDETGWLQALRDYAAPASSRRAAQLQRLPHYRAPDWATHFAAALTALRSATRESR